MELRFEHVSCTFDGDTGRPVYALSDINLTIGGNEFIGLIGHTGSGKSTLVQHANGLLRPTEGHIFADGVDIWESDALPGQRRRFGRSRAAGFNRRSLRSRVGLVFQYPEHQLFETDILSDACFGPKNLGKSEEEARGAAQEALSQVGIDPSLYDASPFDLSGGQKRRVAIAGVLAMQPEILILDEPTAGLDPRGREDILSLIGRLQKERGITIVLVSHSMEDIARYATRLLVMNRGKLMFDDTPEAVFARRSELEPIGLRVPETMQLTDALRHAGLRGIPADVYPVTAEETAEMIAGAMGKGGTPC